jgi:hypothetical protein
MADVVLRIRGRENENHIEAKAVIHERKLFPREALM